MSTVDKPIWITLFGCINELPSEHLSRVLGVDLATAETMKECAMEYVMAHNRAQALAHFRCDLNYGPVREEVS